MQKILKRLVLLLLIAVIAMAVVACSPDKNKTDTPSSGGESVNPTPQPTVNKSVIFEDIKKGLINAGTRIDQMAEGTHHVTSEYDLRANNVNIGIRYEANYDLSRSEDSEIMLNVYNYTLEDITAFVYYDGSDLYYVLGGKRVKIEKFGTTSSFKLFYDAITRFDISSILYGQSFAETIESMSIAAESNKIVRFDLDDNSENITVSDVNLDRLKSTVNDFITDNITSLGTRLDALSTLFLGFNLSELGKVEIGLFTAKKLMTVLEKTDFDEEAVSHFEIEFAGMQTNNINDYYFKALYADGAEYNKISLPRSVDPSVNSDYVSESYGEVYMAGTVKIPYIDAEFYLDLRGDFNTLDNNANKLAAILYERPLTGNATIDKYIGTVATSHFANGTLYLNATNLINNYFGGVADFAALGFPKLRFDNIDISQELRKLIEDGLDIVASGIDFTGGKVDDNRLKTLISKVRSENGVFYITIDAELVREVIGSDSAAVIDYIASLIGIDSKYVDDILSLGLADDLVMEIAYDTINGRLGVTICNGATVITEANLKIYSVTNVGLDIAIPAESELTKYNEFKKPDVVAVKINAEFGAQGNESNDISKFMGILIGDVTGANTECKLKATDKLKVYGNIYEKEGNVYVALSIAINGDVYAIINSDPDDYTTLYIDNRMLGVRYVLARDVLVDSLSKLTGGTELGNSWDIDTISALYDIIVKYGSLRIENDKFVVSLIASASQGKDNLLLKLLGVDSFSGVVKMSVLFDVPEDRFCSEEYSSFITSNNGPRVNVLYGECNPFGVAAGIFGEQSELRKNIYATPSAEMIADFDDLGALFTSFMESFAIPADGSQYSPVIFPESAAERDYILFYTKALEVFSKSLVSFTFSSSSALRNSVLVGVNKPYSMMFSYEHGLDVSDLQGIVGNLFGFGNQEEFVRYAQNLAEIYGEYRERLINQTAENEALDSGFFFTADGSFIFPMVIKNELPYDVLVFVILDTDGNVSVWLNDLNTALYAVNYDEEHRSERIINNELYCKNILFMEDAHLNPAKYYVPAISVYDEATDTMVDEAEWDSIYEAVWFDKASVSIGGVALIMQLNYTEDSSKLITGVYEYHPVAKLFGQNVTYSVYFHDTENGTNVVSALVDYTMTVDPSLAAPFEDTVAVIYNNGRYGRLPYTIKYENGTTFPYNNSNASNLINGLAPANYRLVIGEGSIGETEFAITMTVLCRTIKTQNASDKDGDTPIVARVAIDPYEYSLRKTAAEATGGHYYPIRYRNDDPATADVDESSVLYITFNPYPGSSHAETIALPEFDWGFNEGLITAKGGEYIHHAFYNTIEIAIAVTVLAKEVDYIKINDENNDEYTVDSLVKSTYVIPAATTAENEVRIYFKSGHYRIIGQEPAGYDKNDPARDIKCDGYYNVPLDWSFAVADYVTLDRSVNPLNNGRDNITTAYFGDDIVGKQEISLRVQCPTRIVKTRGEDINAVISVVYDDDGNIVDESTSYDYVRASLASFTEYGSVKDSYFYFDPYSDAESNIYLPSRIYLDVEYRGDTKRRGYSVKWLKGLNDQNDNIVDSDGKIKNAFAEETYLRVYCEIGDGELTQVLTMLIFNRSGSYENVVMRNGDDSLYEGVIVYYYDERGNRIPDGDTTTPVASKKYYIEHINPYDKLRLPEKFTLEFSAESGIPDSTYAANWQIEVEENDTSKDIPVSEFTPVATGATYQIHTNIMGEADTGMLDQVIELYISFDPKIVITDRIYGLYADADVANIPTYPASSGNIPYVEVNTYSAKSYELYSALMAGVTSVGIGFEDGTASADVPITWINLEEFLAALTSPLGSSAYYHPGKYEGNIIVLRGIIEADKEDLKQEVGLGFRINPRVLTGMNFNNLIDEFTTPDDNDVVPVEHTIDMERYSISENNELVTTGKNTIDIKFNKYYTLRGTYINEDGASVYGLCTPSQYIKYLFGAVSLSFADSAVINALQYTLRDDLDDLVYGHKVPDNNDSEVAIIGNTIVIKMTIDKLTEGSCIQSFAVTLTFGIDYLAENEYSLGIETFDEDGNPLFETQEGYLIPEVFKVEYVLSGFVEYDNLVWRALNNESSSGMVITAGQIVRNIRYEFFRFAAGRNIILYTVLPGGQTITLHLHFYSKDVGSDKYSTADSGLYKIVNGTLRIGNVYDVMPVDDIFTHLATTIVPTSTMQFESPYPMTFTLVDGWHPATDFADEDGNFSIEALRSNITSRGLDRTLFAYGYIRGYNDERQRINLYIEVTTLDYGNITHADYEINANGLDFDQYASDAYNGVFVLPKDIKVTFGNVFHQFTSDADIKYELRSASTPYTFTEVTSLTYNNIGHTMGSEYGDANRELYLRVTLPDGNNGLNLRVTFPDRRVNTVYYLNKSNTGVANSYVEHRYYIDPYDGETYTLPAKALFYFGHESEGVEHNVSWTPYGNAADAFTSTANGYRYKGGDYGGASYLFTSTLRSFDANDKEQVIVLHVIVLNRSTDSITERLDTRKNVGDVADSDGKYSYKVLPDGSGEYSYKIAVPFTTYVSDIPYALKEKFNFVTLEDAIGDYSAATAYLAEITASMTNVSIKYDEALTGAGTTIYNAYLAVSAPVVPKIKWYKEADAVSGNYNPFTDDDIYVLGGFITKVVGVFENGSGVNFTRGQTIDMTFSADRREFNRIDGITDMLIELNPFTKASIATSFDVIFFIKSGGADIPETITFYPEYYADRYYAEYGVKRRALIIFNETSVAGGTSSITLCCDGKVAIENVLTTDAIYKFDIQQIGIDEINFGYGDGYGSTGLVELVIDPLNPVIPDKALAKGKILNGKGEIIELDEVDITWDDSIYTMPLAGGTKEVAVTASKAGEIAEMVVRVTYLNRSPRAIMTPEAGFTTMANAVDGFYTLMTAVAGEAGTTRNHFLTLDPINSNLFKDEDDTNVYYNTTNNATKMSRYILPSTLRITYANNYAIGSAADKAVAELGEYLELIDVEWRLSRDISLAGTTGESGTINARIARFKVRYVYNGVEHVSDTYDFFSDSGILGSSYTLLLSTINRQVEYTSVSRIPENSDINYQLAYDEFYIDPYDIKFPESVTVKFTGSAIEELYSDIEWEYDEDYLAKAHVISGNIGKEFMFITGSFKVYGTMLSIQFAIKARKINITVVLPSGEETSVPLSGGTLYVRKGKVPMEEQLPTHLYYRFDYDDNTSQVAAAPLKFSVGNINNLETVEAGTVYTGVSATLGTVDNDNITFTIIVIDPKLYTIEEEVTTVTVGSITNTNVKYKNGGFCYDYIPVGVNRAGQYVAGPEATMLPNKVIVSKDGAYMDIVGVNYNIKEMQAEFRCSYTFLSFNDSPNLSGDADGNGENSKKMELTFTVPIRTYDYTSLEARTVEFPVNRVTFPIGHVLLSSDMPETVNGVTPLWTFDGLNQNRAGEYIATCTYKNAYGEILTGSLAVIFTKYELTASDVTWITVNDIDFLNRVYTGSPLNVYDFIKLSKFLRDDGSEGDLEHFSVQFSIDGGNIWQDTQPVSVKESDSPNYQVKITVRDEDDYNVTGSVIRVLNITKCEINKDTIYFHKGDNVAVTEVTYEYTGREMTPMIGGVPEGASYELVYAIYDPESTNQAYNRVIRPVNVGQYIMRMTFSVDQRNYTIESGLEFTIVIYVVKSDIGSNLRIKSVMEYNGVYRDAIVEGLPEGASDIRVEYTYFNLDTNMPVAIGAQIRDAGNYRVTVKIYGGNNWPSYNTGEVGSKTNTQLIDQPVTIERRRIIVDIGTVESEYLDQLKAMNSSVSFRYSLNPEEKGLVGTDTKEIFGALAVRWSGGELTYKHMVGSYPLVFVETPAHANYEIDGIVNGYYNIVARMQGAVIINNVDDMRAQLATLRDGDSVRWYLCAGNYGDLTINRNASIAIIGSYNLTANEEEVAVYFDSIVINSGNVTLDIVALNAKAGSASVYIASTAGSVTISRASFTRVSTNTLVDSMAVRVQFGYRNTVEIRESYFYGYKIAVYLESGAIDISDSTFYMNDMGVNVGSGSLTINNNVFRNTRGPAVYIEATDAKLSIFDNEFLSNNVAISTNTALRNDIDVQNIFRDNATNFLGAV